MVEREGELKTAESAHTEQRYESSVNPFFFLLLFGWNLQSHMIFWIPMQIHVVTSLTYYLHIAHGHAPLHNACDHAFFLACHPYNLCSISDKDTCVLFTLRTRCISSYFYSQCSTSTAALICQRGSSSQYPTINSFSYFKFLQSLVFGDCSMSSTYNWYHGHLLCS